MVVEELTFREGAVSDLETTFGLSERAMHDSAVKQGVIPASKQLTDERIRGDWGRQRSIVEFIASQPGGRYLIAENGTGPIGYARTVRFEGMEELTELMVLPDHQRRGIGRQLLELAWPGDPSPELGRVVVATGSPSDLSLYTEFGVMPVAGHWHMRQRTEVYLAHRAQEIDTTDPGVHVLKADRAVAEWKRLEPSAIAHGRPELHEFFGRDRTCLATIDPSTGEATSLCWVSSDGDIGPAVACSPGQLVPVVLAALDRIAMTQEPPSLALFTSTLSWWLLRRLRTLGFQVYWPSWVLCSVPLPGLDRYMPTRPPHLL
ncbi:MAG: Acetyltransferase domain [Thermoleophilaceae bacterium]|nr:Acetyltransferase domain [Thermoleophilaceae bacterium]